LRLFCPHFLNLKTHKKAGKVPKKTKNDGANIKNVLKMMVAPSKIRKK